jgi:uroporphyrinogen decarboxylase
MSRADRFLNACHNRPVDATPIWLMRQAGRYMSEYMALRQQYSILEMIHSPELAAEVTLQPIRAFDVDAGIIFSDILPPLTSMGLDLTFIKGEGPVIGNPLRETADIEALSVPDGPEILPATLQAISLTVKELDGLVPLIGFAGAPFTLASYAIEGGSTRNYWRVKSLMYQSPSTWHDLMEKLSQLVAGHLIASIRAGAAAVQIFDSWIGALSPDDYREYVLPHVRRTASMVKQAEPDTPLIYFGTGTAGFLSDFASVEADIIGIDWRQDLATAWSVIGHDRGIQGNLDPLLLNAPDATLQHGASRIVDAANGRDNHIFNLGHGIIKETNPDKVATLVDFVHSYSAR